jgi:hypothetical protein
MILPPLVFPAVTNSAHTVKKKFFFNNHRWANKIKSVNSNDTEVLFNHPYLQSSFMFLGEVLCLIAFFITLAVTVGCVSFG